MNRILQVFIIVAALFVPTIVVSAPAPLQFTQGRIAFSHDGNSYDLDDVFAVAIEWGILTSFGVQDKVVHWDICNNLQMNTAYNYQQELTSGKGSEYFPGFADPGTFLFDDQTQLPQAIANFKKHAEAGNANDRLYFLCAGPMEVPWRMINAVNTDARKYITCISHSNWNETFNKSPSTHTWQSMKNSFSGNGVIFIDIKDQNPGLGTDKYDYSYLKNMPSGTCIDPSAWSWVATRDPKGAKGLGKWDCSDAGMLWYLLTGDDSGNGPKLRERFLAPICGGNRLPTASITSPANGASFIPPATVAVNVTASDADGSVAKVELRNNGVLVGSDNSAPYSFSLANLAIGNYSLQATAYDDNGATANSPVIAITVSNGTQYTLSTSVNPNGSGSVSLNPAGGTYASGTVVTITANPGSGYVFSSWSGALSGSANPTTITMNANKSVTANFSLGSSGINAFSQIEAESYNSMSGVQKETCSEGGQDLGYINNNDYIVFNNVDFGTGATSFDARVASATSGGTIEVRLDGLTGTLVGTCTVTGTGGWQTWVTRNCAISGASGKHNLYLKFTGGSGSLFNFNWFKFNAGSGTSFTLATSATNGSIALDPAGGIYTSGTVVTVLATPELDYSFSSWSGALSGSSSPATITMNANKSVTANFSTSNTTSKVAIIGSWQEGTTRAKVAGTNRALVVMVYGEHTANFSATGVTYGGQTMTKVVEKMYYASGNRSYTGAFILNEAGVASASTTTIAVTWSVTPSAGKTVTSTVLANVNQSSLVGAFASNGLNSVATITTSALATKAGDMVLVAGTGETNKSYTVNNGFTKGIEIAAASFGDGVAGYKLATGANETPSLTQSTAMRQTIVGFVVTAAPSLGKFAMEEVPQMANVATYALKVASIGHSKISFTLPQAGNYSISVYTMAGARVMNRVSGHGTLGLNTISVNQSLLSNQAYVINLRLGKNVVVQKMVTHK